MQNFGEMKIEQKKRWVRTDGWGRGYYVFENSVYSSALLAGEDQENSEVKEDISRIKKALRVLNIPCKTITTRTSSMFSCGIDLLVPVAFKEKAMEAIQ